MATTYKVLRLNELGRDWTDVGDFEAPSAPRAEKTAAERTGVEGTYVGIPHRSFKPNPYAPQTVTRWSRTKKDVHEAKPERALGTREVVPA